MDMTIDTNGYHSIIPLNDDAIFSTVTFPLDAHDMKLWRCCVQYLHQSNIALVKFIWHHQKQKTWFLMDFSLNANQFAYSLRLSPIHIPHQLSLREIDILGLVTTGRTSQQIAKCLHISSRTVDKHLENIYLKTELKNRSALTRWASTEHLFPIHLFTFWQPTNSFTPSSQTVILSKKPTLKVGMPQPKGVGNADGQEMRLGAMLAIHELNQQGGVLGQSLELLEIDCDITSPTSMKDSLDWLIGQDVMAITTGYFTPNDDLLSHAKYYQLPFLHTATLDKMVQWVKEYPQRYQHMFQLCASDVMYSRGLLRFLHDLIQHHLWRPHRRKLVIIQAHWAYMDIGLMQIDEQLFEKYQWEIDYIYLNQQLLDDVLWHDVMTKLHAMNPCVIVFASYLVEESIAFAQAFAKNPLPTLIYKIYSPSVPAYQQTLGDLAEGVVWATTTGVYHDAIAEQFMQRFEQLHGQKAGSSQAGIAYDRIHLLANAWRLSGTVSDFQKVNHSLKHQIYRGVNGVYYLHNQGQVGLSYPDDTNDPSLGQAHLVFQIQQGVQKIISPTPYATGQFRLPAWIKE